MRIIKFCQADKAIDWRRSMAGEKHYHNKRVQNRSKIQAWPQNILEWVAIVAILVVLYTNLGQQAVIIKF